MKLLKELLVLVMLASAAVCLAADTNSNHQLYSLKNVVAYEVTSDAQTIFTLEKAQTGILFTSRQLNTGSENFSVQLEELPPASFMNTVMKDDAFFVFQVQIQDREKRLYETSIFKISTKNGEVERIYNSDELLGIAEQFYATEQGLLLTEKRGNRPYLFNYKTQKMISINLEEDFRVRSFDRQKNTAIIIEQNQFGTNFTSKEGVSSYTEGDGSLLNVYTCDFSDAYQLTKVGQYQPSYGGDQAPLPHFLIDKEDNNWVANSFMVNRYPLSPGELMGDQKLYKICESLVGYDRITSLTLVDDQYAIANQFSEMGETSLVVFDLKNPKLQKDETVAQGDRQSIEELFRSKFTTEKSRLNPEIMSLVFDARFYKIDLVTTEIDSSDGYVSTMTSTDSFLAMSRDDVFSVLKNNQELTEVISDDFLLNEQSAPRFQDALDELFPLGHFAKKHQAFYQKDNQWIFVRDESFGEKVGIAVLVAADGKIESIEPEGTILP